MRRWLPIALLLAPLGACHKDVPAPVVEQATPPPTAPAIIPDAAPPDAHPVADAGPPPDGGVVKASALEVQERNVDRTVGEVTVSLSWPRFVTRPKELGVAIDTIIKRSLGIPVDYASLRGKQGAVEGHCAVTAATPTLVSWQCRSMTDVSANGEGGSPGGYTRWTEVRWLTSSDVPTAPLATLIGPKAIAEASARIAAVAPRLKGCAEGPPDLEDFVVTENGLEWRLIGEPGSDDCDQDLPALDWADIADPSPRLRLVRQQLHPDEETPERP